MLKKKMRRRNIKYFIKIALILVLTIILSILTFKSLHFFRQYVDDDDNNYDDDSEEQKFNFKNININNELIDWHDWNFIENEKRRTGIGENGEAGHLPPELDELRQDMYDHNGFNALLSDKISLNRSVPDIRHKDCIHQKYLSNLPTVSVVIPFYNEHWSTLLRTCYSVLNRSPKHLIYEIILVDDYSNRENLKAQLDNYLKDYLPKVRVVRLTKRSGLITARLAGAVQAKGQVLLFLDSHTEPNTNWLPPLLDPIARNYKVCVCPFIDVIAHETFKYTAQDEGARGAFDWRFLYKRLPLFLDDLDNPTRPFRSPVMAGGLFAISTKFFWELGGYDEGLDIWGGEQYELSFKIWQCGGEMYDVPCSRVGHIYRGPQIKANENPRNYDFVHRNFKRVAEVWMDEYKEYIYSRDREIYDNVDAGDLTKQRAIREKLKCKPFKWFMEEVAFDLPLRYPMVEPLDFAYGVIQSLTNPDICVDSMNRGQNEPIGLYPCSENLIQPQYNQYFALTWHEDIRNKYKTLCFDVSSGVKDEPIILYECHNLQGNQKWHYNNEKKWVVSSNSNRCMDFNLETMKVFVNLCDENNQNMKWKFGFYNVSAQIQ